ncbi:MAG: hypothetical protein ACTMH4_11760 [Sphingobacterium sp.]
MKFTITIESSSLFGEPKVGPQILKCRIAKTGAGVENNKKLEQYCR